MALVFPAKTLTLASTPTFLTFSRKVSWINCLFFCASKICSNATLFNNQINKIKGFMSWNDFPTKLRNFLIKKLKA